MTRVHRDGDLAPRDVVARGIAREVERTGKPVFLTLAHLDPQRVRERFPTIAGMCRQAGLDLATDRIPVGPAAHYLMGGIQTDDWARTSVPCLFAAGETACTGVHGANRLASNSLLEGLVFGARAAEAMQQPPRAAATGASWVDGTTRSPAGQAVSTSGARAAGLDIAAIRELMWRDVGLFRAPERLEAAVAALDDVCQAAGRRVCGDTPADADNWRRLNLATVARLIAGAALRRLESRGGHFRADYPDRDDLHWQIHLVDTKRRA